MFSHWAWEGTSPTSFPSQQGKAFQQGEFLSQGEDEPGRAGSF